MLTQIDAVYGDELGEQALALNILGVTPKDSLLVRQVTGLNPPPRNLFIGDYSRDGGVYGGSRVGVRNVVLTIDLNPNPALGESVSGLRDFLYRVFMDPQVESDHVELVLHDSVLPPRNVVGYAESFETDIFSVETATQVSLLCPDPYIRDVAETVLSNVTGWVTVPFTYTGTAEVGFVAVIRVTQSTSTVTLENNGRKMILTGGFLANDEIVINTRRGERNVTTLAGAPLVARLTSNSKWLELHSKGNTMRVYGADPTTLPAVIKSLTYRSTYWGV